MATAVLPKPQLNALPLGAHSVSALTDETLFEACGVRVAFMSREGGVSEGAFASLNTGINTDDDMERVRRNQAIVLEAMGCPGAPLVVPNQVHGTAIVRVDGAQDVRRALDEAAAGADAVMVRTPGVAALLNTADCLPLIIVAPSGAFAVVHAGWRGALAGIAGKAARALAEAGGEDPAGFNAYIGPHIRQECFETSEEIAAQFADAFGEDVLADSRHVSLARVVGVDLARAGVSAERIADAGICTVCASERYFSYRATDGICGRQAVVAVNSA